MFTLRVMANELASDGLEEEYEDLVDHLCYLLSPFIEEAGLTEKWEEIEDVGKGLTQERDNLE